MEKDFWIQRWQENQIGFHQDDINPYLQQFWGDMNLPPDTQVLVPLCGKSLDMLWLLNRGHSVLGVEISEKAVEAFFAENRLPAEKLQMEHFIAWTYDDLQLLQGDFFKLTTQYLQPQLCVYDRAALVALPETMRGAYANFLGALLGSGCKMLLITMEYPQDKMNGPPFSVEQSEVHKLFQGDFTIQLKLRQDVLAGHRFKERGIDYLFETVYLLEKN